MKNLILLGLVLVGVFVSPASKGQQPFKTGKVKANSVTYMVEEMPYTVSVKNESNTLLKQKPNYNPEQISEAGLNLKEFHKQLKNALRVSLNEQQRSRFRDPIAINLLIRGNGKVDAVSFQLSKNHLFAIQDIESIEKTLTKLTVPVKDPAMYRNINFIPIVVVLKPSDVI